MFGVGFLLCAIGLWLIDCGVEGRSPVQSIEAMISDPKNFRATLIGSKGAIEPTVYLTGDSGSTSPAVAVTGSTSGTGKPLATGSGPVSGKAATIIAFARAQIGKPYKWGGTGPNSYDCSGLVQAAYKAAGVNIPRTTGLQELSGKRVSKADLQPADLVFPDIGHVVLYVGGGNVIEAPHTGEDIHEVPMYGFWTARRYL